MELYFLRHGLADRELWDGPDFERPLTETGKKRMALQAESMAALGLSPELILASPLQRALQTAQIVASRLELQDHLTIDRRIGPGFDAHALRQILDDYPDAGSLMLVGHEPDFSMTISALTGGGRLVVKKGSLARVDVFDPHALAGELVWLIPPKVLVK